MSSLDSHAGSAPQHGGGHHGSYLTSKGSLWADIVNWATTVDHKKIGLMYLTAILILFFMGGVMALVVRIELLEPTRVMVNAAGETVTTGQRLSFLASDTAAGYNIYNRAMTLHGAIMVFMFIVPGIPASLGNFFLPLMIGAKDVAFPRLNLASWYVYVFGSLFALASALVGGIDTGWTLYTPYSTITDADHWRLVSMITGVFIMGFASIMTGLNFVVTTHKLRAPGMGWFDMPLFVWAIYATAIIQVLATPVIGITTLMLIFERLFNFGLFDPRMGGDPVLFQHFFWFYSHPVVYIMILPAFGVISETITCHARKNVFGYKSVAFASLGIAAVSFLVWAHHMFTSQGELTAAIFSFLTFFVAVPTAVKVFNWISTLYKGSIVFNTPMLYTLGFLFLFTIGGLTGLPLATLSTDMHLHDSYYVVAHFHYVMFGGTVIALLAGLHHWWPKMFGKMYAETPAKLGFWLVFLGFNTTFFIQFVMGAHGMPRRYASYPDEYQWMHVISTVGSWMLLAGFLTHLFTFIHSLLQGKPCGPNPWGGMTLEWEADSPPDEHNFAHEPIVRHGPYAYDTEIPPHWTEDEYPLPDEPSQH